MKTNIIKIGIDPGVHTGFAVAENGILRAVGCLKIHQAMLALNDWKIRAEDAECGFAVYLEDARMRKWYGGNENTVKARLQGAGSIKRDCTIWEDLLSDLEIAYTCVAPKNNKTKLTHEQFKRLTGWIKQTNEHGRDAAMLIFERKF